MAKIQTQKAGELLTLGFYLISSVALLTISIGTLMPKIQAYINYLVHHH